MIFFFGWLGWIIKSPFDSTSHWGRREKVVGPLKIQPNLVAGRRLPSFNQRILVPSMELSFLFLYATNGGKFEWGQIGLQNMGKIYTMTKYKLF